MTQGEMQTELDGINAKLKNPHFLGAPQLRAFRVRKRYLLEKLSKLKPISNDQSNSNSFRAHR
jgi:hypothetical protein